MAKAAGCVAVASSILFPATGWAAAGCSPRIARTVGTQRALDAAELRYRSGTDDLTSLLSAQQSYFTASDNYVQGRLSQLTAALNLYVALGGNY